MSMGVELRAMLQRIFDDASTHMMKQYKQCSVQDRGCLYRDGYGNSCAIGGIIKDEFYDSALECMPASHRKVIRMVANSGYGQTDDLELISEELHSLQQVHDGNAVDQWFKALQYYAASYKLNQEALINAAQLYGRNMS